MSLCQTFRQLSFNTWSFLEKARRISHQPLEETVTDNNIVELKLKHTHEVLTKTYNRLQEAVTGADWQWWFTNRKKTAWYGVRIQAKILKFKTDRFEALNYKNQTDVLINDATTNGLVPLYCFYAHWPLSTSVQANNCRTFSNSPESYGCSIVDAYSIKSNKGISGSDSLTSVISDAFPWSCLVCCQGTIQDPSTDLPNRLKSFIDNVILEGKTNNIPRPQVLDAPPEHIIALIQGEGENYEHDDRNLAGVVVVIDNDG